MYRTDTRTDSGYLCHRITTRWRAIGAVSILLGHSSIRITERHYSPWVRSRQEQLERDVRATWTEQGLSSEGTPEVHAGSSRPN